MFVPPFVMEEIPVKSPLTFTLYVVLLSTASVPSSTVVFSPLITFAFLAMPVILVVSVKSLPLPSTYFNVTEPSLATA